jgi:hypothetical protein
MLKFSKYIYYNLHICKLFIYNNKEIIYKFETIIIEIYTKLLKKYFLLINHN